MIKFFKYLGAGVAAVVIILVIAAVVLWRAAQHEDQWYREAVHIESAAIEQEQLAGEEFERQAIDLSNTARRAGAWEARFSDQQINGWLASDLNERFPKALPSSVRDPRVKFETDLARLACRLTNSQIDAVLVVGVDVYLTDQPNELAIRLREARTGLVPVPKARVIDVVSQAAKKANVPVKWAQNDGDPVALIKIPDSYQEIEGRLILEGVELREGEIYFSGRTMLEDGSGGNANVQHIIVSYLLEEEKTQR